MFCRAFSLAAGRWAKRNGATLDTLVLNDYAAPDERYVNGGFNSYSGAKKSKASLIRQYLSHSLTTRYDLIVFGHVYLSPLVLLTRLSASRPRSVVMTYGIEVWHPLSSIQNQALHHADMVLAISDYTKAQLIEHTALPAEKIKIFPCTLDPYWNQSPAAVSPQSSPPKILSVSRMNKEDRYKGIDSVIRSLPAVVEQAGPIEYRIVGQGDDVPRLRALAAGLGVSRYVKFLGGVDDKELREHYQHCSLFVMPSKKEGFGIVFLEAMAYGKPVIGGAHGGTPSVIEDKETGILVDNADVEGIAGKIIMLLNDDSMRERIGEAGRQRLEDEFMFPKFQQNLNEVFQTLLS